MNEIKRAMLGDKEAQRWMTEKGKMLPCMCGGAAEIGTMIDEEGYPFKCIQCKKCRVEMQGLEDSEEEEKELIKQWNTRPQILTDDEMERLERMDDEGKNI